MPTPIRSGEWMYALEVATSLQICRDSVARVCAAGGVRVLKLPTRAPRYHRADVLALLERSVSRPVPSTKGEPVAV